MPTKGRQIHIEHALWVGLHGDRSNLQRLDVGKRSRWPSSTQRGSGPRSSSFLQIGRGRYEGRQRGVVKMLPLFPVPLLAVPILRTSLEDPCIVISGLASRCRSKRGELSEVRHCRELDIRGRSQPLHALPLVLSPDAQHTLLIRAAPFPRRVSKCLARQIVGPFVARRSSARPREKKAGRRRSEVA